ncbi:MAG: AbrB/MazE/SpoVT family DNA-binding domain-containing protein [Acidobacteriota bacterium]|nr:AbrB/MazE/SpoVT family DNA-binding domain-containing protein [Acidobacteriota bacterium]
MISVNARQQGGAVIMTIPADLVKLLGIEAGDPLQVDVVPGGFIARPAINVTAGRYTVAELTRGLDKRMLKRLNTATAWAREGVPVGRELA